MSIKKILVPLTGHGPSRESLQAGLDLAGRFDAIVEALHVRHDPATAMAYAGAGAAGMGAGAGLATIIEAAEAEAEHRAGRARATFDEIAGARAAAKMLIETGPETDVIAGRARLADLVVFPRPSSETSPSVERNLEGVLFESGRPVFLVPPKPKAGIALAGGETIVVGWNDSPEAAHAVTAALPFLKTAARIVVVSIGEEAPVEVCNWLGCHGVSAQPLAAQPESGGIFDDPTGELLLRICAEQDASMLVMGAFTHMRIRQLVIAGATRTVMSDATIPVLMSH